jgi:hypothetical protein
VVIRFVYFVDRGISLRVVDDLRFGRGGSGGFAGGADAQTRSE